MNNDLPFDSASARTRPRRARCLIALVATTIALCASSACVIDGGDETTAEGAAADNNCPATRTTIGYTARVIPEGATLSAQCLPLDLTPDVHTQVPCLVLEGRSVGAADAAACNACGGAARRPVTEYQQSLVLQMQQENPSASLDCFCAIEQVTPDLLAEPVDDACRYDPSDAPVDANGEPLDGFCYLSQNSGIGNPALLGPCPEDQKQALRFVGAGSPDPTSIVYIACVGDSHTRSSQDCTSN